MYTDILTKKEAQNLGIINAEGLGFIKPQTAFKNITERLLAEIKKENLIWRQGWRTGVTVKGKTYGAQNYETQRPYTGGNAFFINMQNLLNGTDYRFFLTAKQISERGGKIKAGAKPFPVSVFIKNLVTVTVTVKGESKDITTEERGVVWYQVFPIDLVEGLKEIKRKTLKPDTFNEVVVADADTLIDNMPKAPPIKHGGNVAYYSPAKDFVQMPYKKAFKPQQNYYSVTFHELIHSTGHKTRLDRGLEKGNSKGTKEQKKYYAFEELIAEIGSAYLCGVCEIDYYTINNSAAYLKNWASRLTDEINADPNFLKRAVFKAARGANFIIGTTLEKHGVVKSSGKIEVKEKPFKGKEITPNKSVKVSVKQAIEDLMSVVTETFSVFKNNPPNLKNIGFMALNLFYSKFKNLEVDDKIEVNGSLSESLLTKVGDAGLLNYNMKFDNEAELTELGKEIIGKIKARLQTLKAKKSGTDLFPELSGVTDTLLLFLNSVIGLHNKTVTREDLLYIINTLHGAIKIAEIKTTHPLRELANTTQTKVVKLINSLKPKERVKVLVANREAIENKIVSLHGLGFWNVIASAVIGKGAEILASKTLFKNKQDLSGIDESVFDELADLYEASFDSKNANMKVIVGALSNHTINKIKEATGKDYSNYKLVVQASEIKHITKTHGTPYERLSNQKSINDVEEFLMYPIVINTCDMVEFQPKGVKNPKNDVLVFSKKIGNRYFIINEIVYKKNELRLKTMYIKKPSKLGVDGFGKATNAVKKTPLSGRPKRNSVSLNIQKKSTPKTPKSLNGVMSVKEAINGTFDLIGLKGDYEKLIGEACKPTSIFIYGPGGSGKSTFTLKFSNYLAKQGNKVLYVAGEQFGTPVFSKMLVRLNIEDLPNFVIVKELNTVSLKGYDFIAIDSKDSLNFELDHFITMRKQNPKLSFVILSQGTKTGNFTGSEKWRNEVDTLLYCEDLRVHSNMDKNRWGGSAEFDILKIK